jgi:hypothetical protein
MMPIGHVSAVAQRWASLGRRGTSDGYPRNGPSTPRPVATIELMITRWLAQAGLRSSHMQFASMGSVGLCIGLWIRAKTVDQDERGNAERRALFVGLWPPTIWLIGDSLQRLE